MFHTAKWNTFTVTWIFYDVIKPSLRYTAHSISSVKVVYIFSLTMSPLTVWGCIWRSWFLWPFSRASSAGEGAPSLCERWSMTRCSSSYCRSLDIVSVPLNMRSGNLTVYQMFFWRINNKNHFHWSVCNNLMKFRKLYDLYINWREKIGST